MPWRQSAPRSWPPRSRPDSGRLVAPVAEPQQRPGERERQGENRVLELDHVEREAQAFGERVGHEPPILPSCAAVLGWGVGGFVVVLGVFVLCVWGWVGV